MNKNVSNRTLGEQIEQLVREHIAVAREEAQAAVQRAFAEVDGKPARPSKPTERTTSRRRRTPSEVAELSEQLYAAVCKMPGETMMVLARQVGVTPRELKVPVARLRRAGRVRGVGQKSHMRYFPMVSDAKTRKGVKA